MIRKLTAIGIMVAAVGMAAGAAQAAPIVFNSQTGLSNTQGANGWSYGSTHFWYRSDYYGHVDDAFWDSGSNVWRGDTWGGIVLSATQQSATIGNVSFPLRYWTADQDYASVDIAEKVTAHSAVGTDVVFVDNATHTTKILVSPLTNLETNWADPNQIAAANGNYEMDFSYTLANVHAGDRIYFALEGSNLSDPSQFPGAEQYVAVSGGMQDVDATITATPVPVPEVASMGLLAAGIPLLLRRKRR